MNKKINIQQISQEIYTLYIQTKDIKKAVEIYLENETKEWEGIIDFTELKDLVYSQLKASKTLELLENKVDIEQTLINTLKQYNYEFRDEQIEVFKELIKFDKAIIYDEDKIFYRLNILIILIFQHLESLDELNKLEEEKDIKIKGVVKTSHPIIKNAIIPRIKTFEEYNAYNNSSDSRLMINLYNDYLNNPLEIRAMYNGIKLTSKEAFIGEEKELVNTIFEQESYLNSATKLEDIHIFRSCQILSFSIYKENHLTNKALQLSNLIPINKLVKYINILIDSFFDYEFESKLNKSHIEKEIQTKDYFNNIEIVEFRTKRNYKENPIFENL